MLLDKFSIVPKGTSWPVKLGTYDVSYKSKVDSSTFKPFRIRMCCIYTRKIKELLLVKYIISIMTEMNLYMFVYAQMRLVTYEMQHFIF